MIAGIWQGARHALIAAAQIGLVSFMASTANAEDGVSDPKQWCATVADRLANGRVDEVPTMAVLASRHGISDQNASGFLAIRPVTESGEVRANSFLIEKDYNNAIRKDWYLVLFGPNDLYIRCTFIKETDGWTLFNLSFDTDEEKIKLP